MTRVQYHRSDRGDWLSGYPVPYIRMTGLEVAAGEIIPRGWGLWYREVYCDVYVLLPIPFNIVARWLRDFYGWMVRGGQSWKR